MAAIITAMEAATLPQALAPLIADPLRSGVLLDVDGTLAAIVTNSEKATVAPATRRLLDAVAERYGLVACVTGRRCQRAREMVGLDSITYYGNHGSELLRPGASDVEVAPAAAEWIPRTAAFRCLIIHTYDLETAGITVEDKDWVIAFHWRGTRDEVYAQRLLKQIAIDAQRERFVSHWGRKILEVRPPIAFSKGTAVTQLLEESDLDRALFAGDDRTDTDAFVALSDAVDGRLLAQALRVGVLSRETPAEIEQLADLMVDGRRGVNRLLKMLVTG